MDQILKQIGLMGLVPVVVLEDADTAVPVAAALREGGLNVMEITLRTEQGIPAIRKVRSAYPDMLVGAGTVLSMEAAAEAAEAGAQFVVSPGFNPALVRWCIDRGMPVMPGCVTPTEISQALDFGLAILKFFPANLYGGAAGCKALSAPYGMVKFVPTGGVDLSNLDEYADKPFIHAIGGGWLCKAADIKAGRFDAVAQTARDSVNALLGFEFAHIGINEESAEKSLSVANLFVEGFGLNLKCGNTSNFAGGSIEVNKSIGPGEKGHIAVRTNSIERAVYYLEKKGFVPDRNTRKGPEERPSVVYFKGDFGGFALHLLQK